MCIKSYYPVEQMQKLNQKLGFTMSIIFATLKSKTDGIENPDLSSAFSIVREAIRHKRDPENAEIIALKYLMAPNSHIYKAYQINHPILDTLQSLILPRVTEDKLLYIPRLFPKITKELILKELNDKTINKIQKISLEIPVMEDRFTVLKDLAEEGSDKVKLRVISPKSLNLPTDVGRIKGLYNKTKGLFWKKSEDEAEVIPPATADTIIIYIHGGGFSAGSTDRYKPILYKWAKSLNAIVFSIDYRLSPANKYPDSHDDVWQAYLWIVNYAQSILGKRSLTLSAYSICLGIKFSKVILSGDSAGGQFTTCKHSR